MEQNNDESDPSSTNITVDISQIEQVDCSIFFQESTNLPLYCDSGLLVIPLYTM